MNDFEIKNLIFDLGGVIILSEDVDFSEFDDKFSLPEGSTEKVVRSCFEKEEIIEDFDVREYLKENFSHLISFEEYNEVINAIYRNEKMNKELVNWIERKKDNYTISLLTNNTSSLDKVLKEKFQIEYLFDFIFNSADIGMVKPNPEIYKHALEKTKTEPKNCLFVDDSERNVKAAKKLGIKAVLFQNNNDFFDKINYLINTL